jgi:hypothetical protein
VVTRNLALALALAQRCLFTPTHLWLLHAFSIKAAAAFQSKAVFSTECNEQQQR